MEKEIKKELNYLKGINEKKTARNRVAVLKKIIKCLDVLANDEFVSQYIGYDNNARRWSPDSNTGVMGKAIELLDPIRYYYVDEEGAREQVLSLHWLQCLSYDTKGTFEKILKYVSMWAHDIFSKYENRDLEVEISYDSTCMEDRWI